MGIVLVINGVTGLFKFMEKGMPLVLFLLKPMVHGNSSSIQQGVILIKTEFITRMNTELDLNSACIAVAWGLHEQHYLAWPSCGSPRSDQNLESVVHRGKLETSNAPKIAQCYPSMSHSLSGQMQCSGGFQKHQVEHWLRKYDSQKVCGTVPEHYSHAHALRTIGRTLRVCTFCSRTA
jgi:hypothetical protein